MKINVNKKAILCLMLAVLVISCQRRGSRIDIDVSDIEIEPVQIKRYEQKLFSIDPTNLVEELRKIQPDYRVFLSGDVEDSLSLLPLINFINDTMLQNVNVYCQIKFPDLAALENELTCVFKHLRYYYQDITIPIIYTYISGFDYEHPVMLSGNYLLIALDMYLGTDYEQYKKLGLPGYIIQKFDRKYIVRDCLVELATDQIDRKKVGSSLLDAMVNEGKKLWFAGAMKPSMHDTILVNYSGIQVEWAEKAEGMIWAFLIENEMLYKTDIQPIQKFILEGPFTSYFGAESPPRLGWFIGWKIVDAYMQNNPDVSLPMLMEQYDAQKILQHSGYKP